MLSINTWVFNPKMSFVDRVRNAKKAGFSALEINFEENASNPLLSWETSKTSLQEVKSVLNSEGCLISSICTELFWNYSLTSSSPNKKEKALELTRKMIEYAAFFEAGSVVVIPGIVYAPQELRVGNTPELSTEVWKKSIEVLSKLAEEAKQMGIILGVENVYFNSFLLSPLEMRYFIETINQPHVKVHLDLGNANILGLAQDWILTLKELICAIHVKDSIQWQSECRNTFQPIGLGNIQWNAVKTALAEINYKGFFIVEQSYRKHISQEEFLKSLFQTTKQLTKEGVIL